MNPFNQIPLTKTEIKVILNEIITPRMQEIGLSKYDGRYLWFSEFDESGMKNVFHYNLMKGNSGTFTFGKCFNFVPTFSNTATIKNHKTDKSTKLHLFEMTDGWRKSFEGGVFTDQTSHWGEMECRNSILDLIIKYTPIMKTWWNTNSTIQQCIETANYQIIKGGGYKSNYPSAKYVKAFLIAKEGQQEEAKQLIHEEFVSLIKWKPQFIKLKEKLFGLIESY